VKLSGDRNQCCACGQLFSKDRRCLTVAQMYAKGMSINAAGFWISSAMPEDVSRSRPMSEGEEVAFASMARAAGWIGY
jgi:hypothetical protein